MKKMILLPLLILVVINVAMGQWPYNQWQKIEIPTTEKLLKVIFHKGEAYVFSEKNVYKSSCLEHWQVIPMPTRTYPTPTVFKNKLYVNTYKGVYVLEGDTWIKVIDKNAASITSDENRMYLFTMPITAPYYCYYTEDGENIIDLPALNDFLINNDIYEPKLTFSKCIGDTIVVSGLSSLEGITSCLRSYDAGLSWTKDLNLIDYYTSDMDVDKSIVIETMRCRQPYFVFNSNHPLYPQFKMYGGGFNATRIFNNVSWAAGSTLNGKGIIICRDDIGDIFYPPEPINSLGCDNERLLAAGDSGSLYLLITEDAYGFNERPGLIKPSLKIYPNPASSIKDLNIGDDVLIYDMNGKAVTENDAKPGMYIIRDNNQQTGKVIIR